MKKILLVDGNNLMFRSYYATAYSGNFMNNSKGFPTNALFGFTNMMNKIINEEDPKYILVAFDKGKTFRHEMYKDYKGGRSETPDELKVQFPIAKKMLTFMGIKYYEIDNYEADDIIGTFSKFCLDSDEYDGTIISSDKDLLQLINRDVDIKLLKQHDYVRYNEKSFEEKWGIKPINVIDLKALMGDSSDNIPGVRGIGEKTALKLLNKYKTIDNLYAHIDEVKGKLRDKLIDGKDDAYKSKELVTIVTDVKMDIDINDTIYRGADVDALNGLYEDLEFYSLLKKVPKKKESLDVRVISNIDEIDISSPIGLFLELDDDNYHDANIYGVGVYNDSVSYFIPFDVLKGNPSFLSSVDIYTYDIKRTYYALKREGILINNIKFDVMTSSELLEYNTKVDISYLANELNFNISSRDEFYGKGKNKINRSIDEIGEFACLKAKFIYLSKDKFMAEIESNGMHDLYYNIEQPLSYVLADMEYDGVRVNVDTLDEMGAEISSKLEDVKSVIYEEAGEVFNISSPKQLGVILFDKLGLPHGKKTKSGYSTSSDVLNKLRGNKIVDDVLEYRFLSKLYSTYIEGLKPYVKDGFIHTIYTQNYTRTGRLSSTDPNLQNIPARNEYGKLVRKAFIPRYDYILSADYSQIELRVLAHMADIKALKDAFRNGVDIHAKTASDIFHVDIKDVTSSMRRKAKAVNFGIIYGISGYGLGENIGESPKKAKEYIDEYLRAYPGISTYMENAKEFTRKNGYSRTLFNRKRTINEINNKNYLIRQNGERMALNTPIQGTAADIIKIAMNRVHDEIIKRNLKSKMIIQVHDEIILDVPKEELEEVKEIVRDKMENACKLDVPLSVDINYGTDWYDAK